MNIKAIIYILGWILNIEGVFMLLPFVVSLIYGEQQGISFLIIALLCALLGIIIVAKKPKNMVFYEKEGYVTVALCWITLSIFGCLPYVLNGEIPHFIDALFEIASGFTTTGASILTDVEAMSYCGIFWRSFTHWIGGMGVLVFLLAIMPLTKGGSPIHLLRAESPGPTVERLLPKLQNTALILYIMYIILSVSEFVFLILGRMPVFDALCTMFASAGTGGFGIKADSMAGYSPYIQWVTATFVMLFGVNFSVYFLLYLKKFKKAFCYEEMRYYLLIIAIATFAIFCGTYSKSLGVEPTLRHAFFQVASIITTTGFATADFNLWPSFCKIILVALMFIGACAGSTGGGIKVSRITTMAKTVRKELQIYVHPGSVKKIKSEGKVINHEVIRAINVFFITYILILAGSVFLISFENHDLVTTFTASLACLGNIGPGLGEVGPAGNFAFFSPLSKIVLIFDMLAGRLEIYPMLLLLNYGMWKSSVKPVIRRKMRQI